MKINFKRTVFVLVGLLCIVAIFIFTKSNVATAAKKDGKKFGDWVVKCTPVDKEKTIPELCLVLQEVNLKKDDQAQRVAAFQLGYFGTDKELKMIQHLPLGVGLVAGTSIISSKKLIAPGKYTVCTNSGCQAVANISNSDLITLLSAKENSLTLMSLDGKQIVIPISVNGLEKALNFIK